MKRLNKLIAIALSLFALLMVSTVTAAGMDSEVLTIAANTDATPSARRPPPPPPPPPNPSPFVKCKVGKKPGVLCGDGFCDTSGGRNPKNLCKGHGGVASPH